MKQFVTMMCTLAALTTGSLTAQTPKTPQQADAAASAPDRNTGAAPDDDLAQLNSDLQRLRVLVNQMRTNLAFVQTTQSPLKHQFEIEADAWQVLIDQIERRMRRVEERSGQHSPH
jgi:hypothetical protein